MSTKTSTKTSTKQPAGCAAPCPVVTAATVDGGEPMSTAEFIRLDVDAALKRETKAQLAKHWETAELVAADRAEQIHELKRLNDMQAAELEELRAEVQRLEVAAAQAKPATKTKAAQAKPAAPADPATLESIAAADAALAYWRTPLCEWVSGDTKPHAAALKAVGAKWSAKKSAWYKRLEDSERATA